MCGPSVYKQLPIKWAGNCALSLAFLNITMYPSLNSSDIPNFGSFAYKIKTRSIANPLIEHQSIGWKFVRALFPSLGVYQLEGAIVNVSIEVEKGFSDTAQAITGLQSELNSLAKVVVQKLDILLAQQGGTCALIHEVV